MVLLTSKSFYQKFSLKQVEKLSGLFYNQRLVDADCNKNLTRSTPGVPFHPPGFLRTAWASLSWHRCHSFCLLFPWSLSLEAGRILLGRGSRVRELQSKDLATSVDRDPSRHGRPGCSRTSDVPGLLFFCHCPLVVIEIAPNLCSLSFFLPVSMFQRCCL